MLKLFGIQRTGTNYLTTLISKNIEDASTLLLPAGLQNTAEWKHGPIPTRANTLCHITNKKAIIIIKNPYTWYTSIVNWTNGTAATSFDGFYGQTPAHVFKRYNELYEFYRSFLLGDNQDTLFSDSILVRYEDLVSNPKGELQRIADKFCLVLKDFEDINKVVQSKPFTEQRRKYYINQKPSYGQALVKQVTSEVDWELMAFYGYKKIL